ncbi:MAG: hypothetical protein ACYDAQ_17210, partial [Mycobacteriales bacterium]
MTARRAAPTLPLWAWAGGVALAAGTLFLGAVAGGLAFTHRLDGRSALAGLGFGGLAVLLVVAATVLAAERTGRAMRALRQETLRRLSDPSADPDVAGAPAAGRAERVVARRPGGLLSGPRSSTEFAEVTRVIDALLARVRVADEVANRHRRSAETASAGMFELLSGLVA